MGFSEISFLFLFLPTTILVYLLVDRIFRNDTANNLVLVLFSLVFYYWGGKESLFVFVQIVLFTYFAGYSKKQKFLFPLVCLLGVLVYYKYAEFLVNAINHVIKDNPITIGKVIMPIGLSFVVFESVSYLVDIYRELALPGSLLDCFTFLSLFPKLVSGPIVLWRDFQPQIKGRRSDLSKISFGIDRIIIGYAKKVILADTFGGVIQLISTQMNIGAADVFTVWLRSLLYCFQLYLDFSGYSDISIGLCSLFGFQVKENFNYPYISQSITEFWRRWHISLGTWFREYVYIPLGGNRKGNVYLHLAIVFVLTGIWHGTGLTFLLWGCVHAVFVVIERAIHTKTWYKKIPGPIKWFFTMTIIFFSWIIFMAPDLTAAQNNIHALFTTTTTGVISFTKRYYLNRRLLIFLIISAVGSLSGVEPIHGWVKSLLETRTGIVIKKVLLLGLFVVDIFFAVNSTYSPFLYFQF